MADRLDQCHWPSLSEKFDQALREAVAFILDRFQISGIIAAGTIIRGHPDPTSDLDLYVIHQEPFRQRIQKFFHGVPAEIFVNPPAAIASYFKEEHASRRPLTAHMLATGFVVLELDPVVSTLREEAADWLAKVPQESPEDLKMARYMAATLYEDALDVVGRDPATAQMLLSQTVVAMIHYFFRQASRFLPRQKDLLSTCAEIDAEIAEMATKFFQTAESSRRLRLAEQIADRTIGVRGFFEWASNPERIGGGEK